MSFAEAIFLSVCCYLLGICSTVIYLAFDKDVILKKRSPDEIIRGKPTEAREMYKSRAKLVLPYEDRLFEEDE